MKQIKSYIWWGGEDLISQPITTDMLSESALKLFNHWVGTLAPSCQEGYFSLLDMPFSDNNRLIITAYRQEKSGKRTVIWYLGILISKQFYSELKSLQCLYLGLNNLSIKSIKETVARQIPLALNTQYSVEQTPIGQPLSELVGVKIITNSPDNIKQLAQKISINAVDEWFEQLFIAINPTKCNDKFTIIAAEVNPSGNWHPAIKKLENKAVIDIETIQTSKKQPVKVKPKAATIIYSTKNNKSDVNSKKLESNKKNIIIPLLLVMTFIISGLFIWDYIELNKSNKKINELQSELKTAYSEKEQSNTNINLLKKRLSSKEKNNIKLKKDLKQCKQNIYSLKSQLKEKEQQIIRLRKENDQQKEIIDNLKIVNKNLKVALRKRKLKDKGKKDPDKR